MSLSPNSWKFAETKKSTFAAQINISREWTSTFFNLTGNITDYDNEPQPLRLEAEIVVPKEEESHLIIDSKGKSINGRFHSKNSANKNTCYYIRLGHILKIQADFHKAILHHKG